MIQRPHYLLQNIHIRIWVDLDLAPLVFLYIRVVLLQWYNLQEYLTPGKLSRNRIFFKVLLMLHDLDVIQIKNEI